MDKLKEVFLIKTLVALMLLISSGTSIAQLLVPSDLGGSRAIPLTDPYCGANGYVQTVLGITIDGTDDPLCDAITITDDDNDDTDAVPSNVSDWVLIELRGVSAGDSVANTTQGTVVARKPAFLLNTGYVLDADEYSNRDSDGLCEEQPTSSTATVCPVVQFGFIDSSITEKRLYAVVRHLNHLDVISNTALTTMTSTENRYRYDFTEEDARGGFLSAKKVNVGDAMKNAMYVGDVNGDTNINAADYLKILSDRSETTAVESDVDFDGAVNNSDVINNRLRENLGRSSQLP